MLSYHENKFESEITNLLSGNHLLELCCFTFLFDATDKHRFNQNKSFSKIKFLPIFGKSHKIYEKKIQVLIT